MNAVEIALNKIRAVISKDNHIISHHIRNRNVVAIVAKRNVGMRGIPVSASFHVHTVI